MAKAEEDIKKVFVFKEDLKKVNKNNKHHLRFRITTEDVSRVSSWSTFYEIDGAALAAVKGTATGIVNASTLVADSILFSWGDANQRPEYDIFIAEGRNIAFRSLTTNVATIITTQAHGFIQGDVVNVEGTGSGNVDGTNLTIANVINTTAFTYSKVAGNISNGAANVGAGVYLVSDQTNGALSAYEYHGTSPTHTYSIVKTTQNRLGASQVINRIKFIIQTASYENVLSSTIEVYPKLGTYTESFSV
jgi:hypothetical protein